jgi:tetratricopeptide (TPR) repeat protein
MGRTADAVKCYEESLNIRRKLAAASFDVYGKAAAESAAALGRLYMEQNNDSDAEPLLREAVDAYRRVSVATPGAFDAETARSLQELALLYFKAKDLARARQTAEEGLALFSRLRTANAEFNHESMARCMLMYAGLTERENFSRACAMVGDAAQLATDAATRQASQTGYARCSQNPAFRRTR